MDNRFHLFVTDVEMEQWYKKFFYSTDNISTHNMQNILFYCKKLDLAQWVDYKESPEQRPNNRKDGAAYNVVCSQVFSKTHCSINNKLNF